MDLWFNGTLVYGVLTAVQRQRVLDDFRAVLMDFSGVFMEC